MRALSALRSLLSSRAARGGAAGGLRVFALVSGLGLGLAGPACVADGEAVADPDGDLAQPAAVLADLDGRDGLGGPDGAGLAACPPDMIALPGACPCACMDRYEAPNVKGARPLAMQTALEGEAFCAARGKRLCTEAEWVRACQGSRGQPFPYGPTYRRSACSDDKTWISPNWTVLGTWPSAAAMAEAARLYQADPSGSRSGCASEEGASDLTGNVAEWVRRSFTNRTNYDHVMKGCYWAGCYGGSPPSCAFVNPAHPGAFRTYEAGFRCCLDRGARPAG